MKLCGLWSAFLVPMFFAAPLLAEQGATLPNDIQKILDQPKYAHGFWALYVKDLETGKVLYDLNSEKLFSPASTTKLFSMAALLNALGDDYRFKTPVYSTGDLKDGVLTGNLILVAQGDLTFGGRQGNTDKIAFTKMDHTIANQVPGTILTPEDPMRALNDLAKQVAQKGIKKINGDILIDDSLFETVEKRDMELSPIMLNENLIDIVINPSAINQKAIITWRPEVPGYTIDNQVTTVAKDGSLAIEVIENSETSATIKGTIPLEQKDVVRVFSIHKPIPFVRAAFIKALKDQGVEVSASATTNSKLQPLKTYPNLTQVALWTSPPITEYVKLILKVSHNTGANLAPLLIASHNGKKTYDEGMLLIGDFIEKTVKISPDEFVLIDGAGGNENRLTPHAEVELLSYMKKLPPKQFQAYFDALPILGVDGSLEDFAKKTPATGKVRAKPGTGVSINLATNKLFLITQAFAGYIQGKNGHFYAYMLAINNGNIDKIEDIFGVFEDEGQLSNAIYEHTGE